MFRFVVIIGLVLTFSCKSQKSNDTLGKELVLVLEDAYYPVDASFSTVIKDQKSLKLLFSKINKTRKPGFTIPRIDFNKKTLIFFAAGKQKGIEKVKLFKKNETDEMVKISLDTVESQAFSEIVSFPFCLYEFPKTNKNITLDL